MWEEKSTSQTKKASVVFVTHISQNTATANQHNGSKRSRHLILHMKDKPEKRDREWQRHTHLEVIVVTNRLRVSSSVNASKVRHWWARTQLALWLLHRPNGLHVSKGLRWHIHKKFTRWFNGKNKRSYDEKVMTSQTFMFFRCMEITWWQL